jgi:hypothetical protein
MRDIGVVYVQWYNNNNRILDVNQIHQWISSIPTDFAKYLENIWPGRFRCETTQTHCLFNSNIPNPQVFGAGCTFPPKSRQ